MTSTKPPPQLDRVMLLAYIDQRRDWIDKQITLAPKGSKNELYWMAAWAEATSFRNAVFTGDYNQSLDVHHKTLVPTRKADPT